MLRSAAALVCATGCAGLLRPAALPVANGVETTVERGVRIIQHGGYPELQVDGKPFFVNSAEFFYPRIPRNLWEPSLDRYRELGINTISLSIPWNWHEPREGEFDFDGHTNPRRDLRALLKLIGGKGFKLITRPGPIVGGEWRSAGYPEWLLERPEYQMPLADRLEAREPPANQLNAANADSAARAWLENPVHMAYAAKWLDAVAHQLASPGAEAPGQPLFIQVENGLGSGRANFAGTEFWRYVEALCGVIARGGVDAPCLINPSQPRAAAAGSRLAKPIPVMGQWFLTPQQENGTEPRRISPVDLADLKLTVASLAEQPVFPPILSEFNAGWPAPVDDARPEQSPAENLGILSHLLIGYGVRGFSWFPLQDSLTPGGYETLDANRFYRWDAALALNGTRQPGSREVQRVGDWLRAWGSQLAASHPRADFGLVDALAAMPPERHARADVVAVTNTTAQIERLAQYAGMTTELVDPEHQPPEQLLRHALLLLPAYKPEDAAFALTEKAQRALDAFVRGGGVLVCFPSRPSGAIFEAMQAGTAGAEELPEGMRAWHAGAGRLVVLTKDFYSWVSLREKLDEGMKRPEAPLAHILLAELFKMAGARQCIHREDSRPEAAQLVVSELVSNEGTLPLGNRSGGQGWLSVVNLSHDATMSETLHVLSPRVSSRTEKAAASDWIAVPVTLPPQESLLLPLDVGLCLEPEYRLNCEDHVVSSGAELARAEREGKAMFLTFYAPAKAEVRVHLAERPHHFEVDGAQADAQWLAATHEMVLQLLRGASPQFLRVVRVPLSYKPALHERPDVDRRHSEPAHFHFSPAGAVRLPLGDSASLLTNPPLFVFHRGEEGSFWVMAENLGGQGASVQVQTTGEFNTSARAYVNAAELRSLSLKFPASAVEKAAASAPAADGLYHGKLQFAAGSESQDLAVAYAILPEKGSAGYQFDFAADGSEDRVMENAAMRAIVSPVEGGRIVGLVARSTERNLASTMGLLEDVFAFTPNPQGTPPERARGLAGTFNRPYSAEWVPGAEGPALRLRYEAPDVYPHGARIEKTAKFSGERTLAVEYQVSLLPADARRLAEEAAGRIFAAPPPNDPVEQSFAIVNSVPAAASAAKTTQFCWKNPGEAAKKSASAEHCEEFEPGGPRFSPPTGVMQIEIREPGRPGLAISWEDPGARLTLEPKTYSALVRLAFPALDPGGAPATYRIEFSVKEAP